MRNKRGTSATSFKWPKGPSPVLSVFLFLAVSILMEPPARAGETPSLGAAYSRLQEESRGILALKTRTESDGAAAASLASDGVESQIDLHSHSYCSDGTKTPEVLAREAREAGLRYWALSDHDTAACLQRAAKAAKEEGIALIPSSEISAEDDSVHILALEIDPQAPGMKELYHSQDAARMSRLKQIIAKLQAQNIDIDLEMDVFLPKLNRERVADGLKPLSREEAAALGEARLKSMIRGQLTRPDVAQALVERGFVASTGEAFGRYLADGNPAYVPMAGPNSFDVIRRIHDAGGLAVLAHPYTIFKYKKPPYAYARNSYASFDEFAGALLEAGLDGIEVYKPRGAIDAHRIEAIIAAYQASSKRVILETPGSDYHGGEGAPGSQVLGHIMMPAQARDLVLQALHLSALTSL